ncbi:MAG: aminotransferase class V-fold PLP-dependent enzyme, partial [Alphaproteobacteria bacterium]
MDTYLDYNATTPLRPEVIEAMANAAGTVGNASSVHRFGRLARRAVEDVWTVAVDRNGVVDMAALGPAIEAVPAPVLVSVMLANNETGVIQPVAQIAAIAHEHGALVHCDAVQAAGRLPVDIAALGVDMLTLSAHKLGGPQGVGALVLARDVRLDTILRGGGQERGRRAGTENVAGIVGFGAAARLAARARDDMGRLATLRDGIEA